MLTGLAVRVGSLLLFLALAGTAMAAPGYVVAAVVVVVVIAAFVASGLFVRRFAGAFGLNTNGIPQAPMVIVNGGAPVAVAPALTAADPVEQLSRLGELHERGALTDEEFTREKQRILANGAQPLNRPGV